MHLIRTLLPGLLVSTAAFCQQFEVASIKKAPPYDAMSGKAVNIGVKVDGAQVHISNLTLRDYISAAYKVRLYQIITPESLPNDRYDIDAVLPAGSKREDVPVALQELLKERFQMKSHMETRDLPAYVLTAAKGGFKLQPVELDPAPEGGTAANATDVQVTGGPQGTTANYGRGSYFTLADNKIVAHKLDMLRVVDLLGRFLDLPVVDQTGITGNYDLELQLTQEDYMGIMIHSAVAAGVTLPPEALKFAAGNTPDSLFAALKAVGLNLEKKKAPIQVLVVDSISKTPTEN